MKKYCALFFITFFLVISIICSANYFVSSIKEVDAIYLEPISVGDYVNCSGKVEYADSKQIYIDRNSIIQDVYVSEGDKVKKGDKLMEVVELSRDEINFPIDNYNEQFNQYSNISNLKDVYCACLKQGGLQKIKKSAVDVNTQKENQITILASDSGTVSKVNFNMGSVVRQGDPILTISDTRSFQVHLNINESRISNVKLNQKAIISGVGFKDRKYNGTVKKISNEAKQLINPAGSETVVDVVVTLDDCEDLDSIKPGFTAKCKIQTEEHKNLLIIPYDMVKADDTGKEYIYKYKNGCALKSYITTGKEFEEGFEVLNGIDIDDMVITDPNMVHHKSYVKLI